MEEPKGVAFKYVNGKIDGKINIDGLTQRQAIFILTVVEEKIKSKIIKSAEIKNGG